MRAGSVLLSFAPSLVAWDPVIENLRGQAAVCSFFCQFHETATEIVAREERLP